MPGPVVFNQAYYKTNDHVPQHITVNVGNQNLGHVGGNLSSRTVLTVQDEAGHQVKGFFTENEYNSVSGMFASRFHPTLEDPQNEDYRPIHDNLQRKGFLTGPNTKLADMFRAFGSPLPQGVDGAKKFLARVKSEPNSPSQLTDTNKTAMLRWLNDNAMVAMEDLEEMAKKDSFWNYICQMMFSVSVATMTVGAHISKDLHAQSLGGNINKRNNAMYDYASLLGEPELLAKSSSMTLADGGKKLHGTFMVNAEGVERKALYQVACQNRRDLLISGSGLRDLSKLQIIDYLCGNFDRHYDNWFYKYEETNQEVRITGVQGIDNDASFGTVQHKGKGVLSYMSRLEDIKVIDKQLAQNILSADFEKIEERLHLAELSAEEIDAARQRLSDLQKRLRSGKIEIVNDLAAWDQKMIDDPNMENLRYMDDDQSNPNIFQLAYEACDNYNPRKRYPDPGALNAPVGNAAEIIESGSLGNQLDRFSAMQKSLAAVKGQDIGPVKEKLADVLNTLQADAGKDFLSDMERNLLAEQLKDLSTAADAYAEKHEKDAKSSSKAVRNGLNDVKNLASFARFSRQSVQNDALEQEKNAASYQAEKIAEQNNIHRTAAFSNAEDINALNATYAGLKKELSAVDSAFIKSSPQFKDMMDAFKALKDAPDKNDALAALSYLAQRYINYKTKPPKGKAKPKLSEYAEKRVAYARRILDFSFKAAEYVKPDYRKQAEELIRFNNQCAQLMNDYTNALHSKNEAKIQQAKDGILGAGEFFMKGCQKMFAASASYDPDHSMQLLCHSLLIDQPGHMSSINALATVHANLTNEKNGVAKDAENAAKPYASLGLSPMAVNDLKTKLKNSPAVTQPHPQAPAQPQKDAKKEKVVDVLGNS